MGTVTKKNTFSAGTTILSAQVNENFDDIYNEFNGSIENANIGSSAAIVDTKLAQIATAGKVAGTALTSLTGIPAGAGLIPSTSQDTVSTLSIAASAVATDSSAATIFQVTLTENVTLSNPTNSVDGMKRMWRFRQDGTGGRTVSFGTDFRFSVQVLTSGSLVISSAASSITYIGAVYDGTDSKWDIIAIGTSVS